SENRLLTLFWSREPQGVGCRSHTTRRYGGHSGSSSGRLSWLGHAGGQSRSGGDLCNLGGDYTDGIRKEDRFDATFPASLKKTAGPAGRSSLAILRGAEYAAPGGRPASDHRRMGRRRRQAGQPLGVYCPTTDAVRRPPP